MNSLLYHYFKHKDAAVTLLEMIPLKIFSLYFNCEDFCAAIF